MPRSALNFLLFVATFGLLRFLLWHYSGQPVERWELWSVLGVGVSTAFAYQFMPSGSKDWFQGMGKRIFGSEGFTKLLLAAFAFQIIVGGLISYVDVEYASDSPIIVRANNSDLKLVGKGERQRRYYLLSLRPLALQCGDFSSTVKAIPFRANKLRIPFDVTAIESAASLSVEKQLTLALYQTAPYKYIQTAKGLMDGMTQNSEQSKSVVIRLQLIAQTLELCLVNNSPDPAQSKETRLNEFETKYPEDSWLPMLRAIVAYSERKYENALSQLNSKPSSRPWPGAAAVNFVRGLCNMKLAREAKPEAKASVYKQSLTDFKSSESQLEQGQLSEYRDHAYPSAMLFQAMIHFYQQQPDEARRMFTKAAHHSSKTLRARAFNGLGFIQMFYMGKLDEAENSLNAALESDPTFAYARSNLGYVLLAKNEFTNAIAYFKKNSEDDRLALESPRDVLLAKIAVAHAMEQLGTSQQEIVELYASALRKFGFRDFSATAPEQLRLAYLYNEIGEKVYLNPNYNGLEIFALTLFAKALKICEQLESGQPGDARVQALRATLTPAIHKTQQNVPNNRYSGGFFDVLANLPQTEITEKK